MAASRPIVYRRLFIWLLVLAAIVAMGPLACPELRHGTRYIALLTDTLPSRLPVPVAGVKRSQLADTWGAARSGGRRHEGIDIFARRNTPIRSATRGIVVRKGWNDLGGNSITVLGPGRSRHYYAHLHRHGRFEKGDWVEQGDTIGFVGNTGNATGTPPHLHYGIYTGSEGAVNPYAYLRDNVIKKKTATKKRK